LGLVSGRARQMPAQSLLFGEAALKIAQLQVASAKIT
jgi:hypothetical protein